MTQTTTPGSKVGRARRQPGQLWQVPTFVVGVLALVGVAVSAPWRLSPQARELDGLIAKVRAGLDNAEDAEFLIADAEKALNAVATFPSRCAEVHFLVGSVYFRQAKDKTPALGKDIWPRATQHLEEALLRGPSDDDRSALQYRLGYALYQQNKQTSRALDLMALNLDKGAEQPLHGYKLLVEGHLKQKPANLDGALAALRRVVDLTPERDLEALALARIQMGELLLRQDKRAEAINELSFVGAKAPRNLRLKARFLKARACEEDGQWGKAVAIWNELLADAQHVEGGRARILYQIGWCHQQKDPPDGPATTLAWEEALKLGGPAGQAAGLRLGQAVLASNVEKALTYWKAALEKVHAADELRNPFIERDQLHVWLEQAVRLCQEKDDAKNTQAFAELYRKVDSTGKALDLAAEAAEAVAKQLADQMAVNADAVKAEDVAAHFRRAGEAFEQAAKARPEDQRADRLWRAVQCFRAASDMPQAQRTLAAFVQIVKNDARSAEAWYTLGNTYRIDGKKDLAAQAYVKCIEIPNTVFANRARFHLAVEEIDHKRYVEAHEILKQILATPAPEIDRPTHEKTHFKLATLLMQMKHFGEAYIALKGCIQLYPDNANALLAREQYGECCRQLADLELKREIAERKKIALNQPDEMRLALEDNVRAFRNNRQVFLMEARKTYQALADELGVKKSRTNLDQILLRRAWFGVGECYLDDEQFLDALQVFQALQQNHRATLEGFFACLRICDLAEVFQQPPKKAEQIRDLARDSVRMTLDDLHAMPADHDLFRMNGVSPRSEWLRWAQEMDRRLQTLPRKDAGASLP